MNASKTNARIVLPVTTYENITKGVPVDYIFYANNYENVDSEHPIIERFVTPDEAFHVFREGTVMSKGTTTSTGLVHSYFANISGRLSAKPSMMKSRGSISLIFSNRESSSVNCARVWGSAVLNLTARGWPPRSY
jgi:hypothetical protein